MAALEVDHVTQTFLLSSQQTMTVLRDVSFSSMTGKSWALLASRAAANRHWLRQSWACTGHRRPATFVGMACL